MPACPRLPGRPRFSPVWQRLWCCRRLLPVEGQLIASHRPLWTTQFELIGQLDRLPQLHDFMVESHAKGRAELATLFSDIDPASPSARAVGAFHQALLAGVMV